MDPHRRRLTAAARPGGGRVENWRRNPLVFWMVGLPPTVWLLLFFLVPLGLIWILSFAELRGLLEMEVTGTLDNYARALDPLYLQIFA